MKSTIGGRMRGKDTNARDRVSLLANPSPPPSPSPFGLVIGNPGKDQDDYHDVDAALSFDVAMSQLPPESRFLPQHDPKADTRRIQRTSGALQFVPAYEESTTSTITTAVLREAHDQNTLPWDAVIEADDHVKGKSRKKKSVRARSDDRSVSSGEEKSSAGTGIFLRKQPQTKRPSPLRSGRSSSPPPKRTLTALPKLYNEETASTVSANTRRGPRMARLAALFTSRAVVGNPAEGAPMETTRPRKPISLEPRKSPPSKSSQKASLVKTTTKGSSKSRKPPPSPSRSSVSGSSGGYVGWPGTQDKKGGTVAIQSSYDDSSVGAAAFHRLKYEDSSDGEVHKWIDSSFEEGGSEPGTPDILTPLERRIQREPPYDEDDDQNDSDEDENAADFHLAAIVADATTAAASPLAKKRPKNGIRPQQPVNSNRPKLNGESLEAERKGPIRSAARPKSAPPRSVPGTSRTGASSVAHTSVSGSINIQNLFGNARNNRAPSAVSEPIYKVDPWDVDSSSHPPSSPGTSISRDSSAYFQTKSGIGLPGFDISQYGIRPNMRSAASIMRQKPGGPQPPTQAALAVSNHLAPQPRPLNAHNVRGYRAFFDKTKDVPNLIDTLDSESVASSRATSVFSAPLNPRNPNPRSGRKNPEQKYSDDDSNDEMDADSDVFDGLSNAEAKTISPSGAEGNNYFERRGAKARLKPVSTDNVTDLNLVLLGGGLTAIQTTPKDYDTRRTSSDFDENLTNSDVDQFGFARIPGLNDMISAGRKPSDSARFISRAEAAKIGSPDRFPTNIRGVIPSSAQSNRSTQRSMFDSSLTVESESESSFPSDAHEERSNSYFGDLSEYSVHPKDLKKMVRKYREMFPPLDSYRTREQFESDEDAKKAFALLEMRSRIMEKDIERGLERQGGTVTVDDLVTTPYYQAAQRVRDAVIVSKAWRDGASPRDVITAWLLTRRTERTHYVKRPVRYRGARTSLSPMSDSSSGSSEQWMGYTLEPVRWVDDTDFIQLRCPSLGPRCMRGFEMFTIGDCQSILLKLTNERCMNLRWELNDATARQIEAEDEMKEEGDAGDGMMTTAEMMYLTSMEEVKTISKKLVVAEKSFNLVRDRIEKLVAKYETLLMKIENESLAASSVITYDSDYDSQYSSEEEDKEKAALARRAQRAELRAELAAREAFLAKQEALKIREEKQRELELLQQKLIELQSESSNALMEREHSAILAKAISGSNGDIRAGREHGNSHINQDKVDGVKRKFRDRMAERIQNGTGRSVGGSVSSHSDVVVKTTEYSKPAPASAERPPLARRNRHGLIGEEMFQHLDFYERSLRAVQNSRGRTQ